VSRIWGAIRRVRGVLNRDLSRIDLEYLYLHGSHFKMHPGASAEPVLVAWGITADGKPLLLSVEPGATSRSTPGVTSSAR